MLKDQSDILESALVLGPISISADNVPVEIDLDGYEGATVQIAVGIGGITFDTNNKIEFVMTHTDTSGTGYAAVAATDVHGVTPQAGGIVKSLVALHAAADVTEFGYVGRKRYVKILADFSGTHGSPTPICVMIVKGYPQETAVPA